MDEFHKLTNELRLALGNSGLSREQVSAAVGKSPEFFDELCKDWERFTISDYRSVCRALGGIRRNRLICEKSHGNRAVA